MGVGGGQLLPMDFENFNKKVVFLISSGKKQILPLFPCPGKIL